MPDLWNQNRRWWGGSAVAYSWGRIWEWLTGTQDNAL